MQEGRVILVGHSYGGAVISGAGHHDKVVGLVYIAAFAPDKGESMGGIFERREQPSGAANIYPDSKGFLWIKYDKFHESFAQDLNPDDSVVMSLSQNQFMEVFSEQKLVSRHGKPNPTGIRFPIRII